MKTVAMAILEQLAAWGVKYIYGYVGDSIFPLMDALAKQNQIQFIAVKHEEGAALMASAQAKLTGEIGVCLADGGPGTVHLLNGLADACLDHVPVLAITGQVSRKDIGTNVKQYIEQQSLLSPLVSYTSPITDQAGVSQVMEKALRKAIVNRSVTHISIPVDVLQESTSDEVIPFGPYLKTNPISTNDVLDGAVQLMAGAKRPVILVGEGGREAKKAVAELAVGWGSAIATTLGGLGVVDYSNPLYIGNLGQAGNMAVTSLLSQADMCLIIGANWWPSKYVSKKIPLIQVDMNPANIGATTPVSYGIVGKAEEVIPQLYKDNVFSPNKEWQEKIVQVKAQWQKILDEEAETVTTPMHPAAVIRSIENALSDEAIICLDTGEHTLWFGRGFRPRSNRVLFSGKWRTMGFGVPAAIAAKLIYPEKQVMAIVGDGGFTMTMSEVLTAVKYQLPITIVVFNNKFLSMEKNKMVQKGLTPLGTELNNPDFASYARACGCQGYKVESQQELEEALAKAHSSNVPTVIDVHTSDLKVP
jgi:pyruvate oxidase